MSDPRGNRTPDAPNPIYGMLAMFAFGVAVLTFLIAVERSSWFHLKPASGTAAAMGHAAALDTHHS